MLVLPRPWGAAIAPILLMAGTAGAAPPDLDRDGMPDPLDNCVEVSNADQLDSDDDGFGNACDPDLDQDGVVDADDLDAFELCFLSDTTPECDFDGDGRVSFDDLAIMREMFRRAPGPKGRGPTVLLESSPRSGETAVALSRESILRFSHPLDLASIDDTSVQVSAAGTLLDAVRHLSADGRSLTLFYDAPLPPSTAVRSC